MFEIIIGSAPDKENLIAEIYYNNTCWAQISQETKELLVQFYPHPQKDYWEFSLEEALCIIEQAKNKLLKLNIKFDP
jgi:hypothetical protein